MKSAGLLSIGLALAGCSLFEQGGQTTVEGVVVDDVTGQPIGLADVAVLANKHSSSSSAFSQVGDWHPTDAQGRFSFAFEANGETDYVLRADAPRGSTQYLSAPKIKAGRKNKDVRVPLTSIAWMQVHLRDVPPRADALNITVGGFLTSVTIRPPLDTIFYRPVPSGSKNVVVWSLNGSPTVSNAETRIPYTVAGADTARIEIRY
ncbi:carboxypeptidase-like regulatory domain-containing protein [Hymenobacter profundi]|uniref:Carboxypeptidase-like regulatory domain-containing protein n=1 Tax=Hymenobacter profundi TaxID=1982110 RepID=A0ABS6WXH3_9BACT|nr:carboxypeptidase-like regulatory domain-containing protein [Hymenobacter profundi]MBW3128211.1 carboxypeptidase-like regulatory domain-containing protein [Hymenobacter profundi]